MIPESLSRFHPQTDLEIDLGSDYIYAVKTATAVMRLVIWFVSCKLYLIAKLYEKYPVS